MVVPANDEIERYSVAQIERMVHRFYERVRDDDLLGPVFARRVDRWAPHLDRMVLFWRAVLRSEGPFVASARGGPPVLHRAIDELSAHHFERWLSLFGEVVDDIYEPPVAQNIKQTAGRIAVGLSRHLAPPYRPGLANRDHS